jgi:hypothetical protein
MCEDCGYVLEGLPPGGACSECGRAIASSAPEYREGSAWQKRTGPREWWATNVAALRRPTALFSAIRIERGAGTGLLLINVAVAAVIIVAPWTGTLIGDPVRSSRGGGPLRELLTFGWVFPAQVAVVAAILLILTWIEYQGIRFFAARRGWRLTRVGAWQVCCHASVGWIVLGVAPLLAMALVYTVGTLLQVPLGRSLSVPSVPALRTSIGTAMSIGLPLLGVAAGLFVYEWLVHQGVRRCRYAATLKRE